MKRTIKLLALTACSASLSAVAAEPNQWIASWGDALVPAGAKAALHDDERTDVTLRQVVRLSIGGSQLRVRVSNLYGGEPLVIGSATVATDASPLPLRFGGAAGER